MKFIKFGAAKISKLQPRSINKMFHFLSFHNSTKSTTSIADPLIPPTHTGKVMSRHLPLSIYSIC